MAASEHHDNEKIRRREARLVRLALKGDSLAFDDLTRPYKAKIKGLCRGYLRNREDIEDALQETLLSVFTSLHTFDCARDFLPWLYRIAMRRVVDEVRRSAKGSGTVSFGSLVAGHDDTRQDHGWHDARTLDPQDLAWQNDQKELVWRALEKLPKRQQEVVTLQCLGGLSVKGIADRMDVSKQTVVGLLYRARPGFAEIYKKLGGG